MKITRGSRRTITPTTPMENSTAESARYHDSGGMLTGSALPPPGQPEDADRPEVDDEEEGAVDRIALDDEAERRPDGDAGDEHERNRAHHTTRSAGMGTGERGTPSGPTGSSASSISFV